MSRLDHSVYPDLDRPPRDLHEMGERADYVHRICGAWDFGVVPEAQTFDLLRGWREVFDRHPVPTSTAYHAFRAWFGWPPVPAEGDVETEHERLDRREGRGPDPCQEMI